MMTLYDRARPRSLYWSGSSNASSSVTDDTSVTNGTCSKVEHVFQPIAVPKGSGNRSVSKWSCYTF